MADTYCHTVQVKPLSGPAELMVSWNEPPRLSGYGSVMFLHYVHVRLWFLTADASGELQVLAIAVEEAVSADEEVAGSAPSILGQHLFSTIMSHICITSPYHASLPQKVTEPHSSWRQQARLGPGWQGLMKGC
jgi:hypothetical protein